MKERADELLSLYSFDVGSSYGCAVRDVLVQLSVPIKSSKVDSDLSERVAFAKTLVEKHYKLLYDLSQLD